MRVRDPAVAVVDQEALQPHVETDDIALEYLSRRLGRRRSVLDENGGVVFPVGVRDSVIDFTLPSISRWITARIRPDALGTWIQSRPVRLAPVQ